MSPPPPKAASFPEVKTDNQNLRQTSAWANGPVDIDAVLLTGAQDGHYAFGLATALATQGVSLDIIGGDEVDCPAFHDAPRVRFLNLKSKHQGNVSRWRKVARVLAYYAALLRYSATAKPRIFHILWNGRFEIVDRTLLLLFYKLLKKKVVFTAHNVNAGKRDSRDSLFNRITLKIQYHLVDHIFVHTKRMKRELLDDFEVREQNVTVISYGINNAVPETDVTCAQAKQRLGIKSQQKTILFFGHIAPYKGLDLLVEAFQQIMVKDAQYILIVAGQPKKGSERYCDAILRMISSTIDPERVITRIEYIPDEDAEIYFKAADLVVLPYTEIFQSGILFWAFTFGLPVVAADVGSFRDDVVEGRTGYLCKPCDSIDLAATIQKYFDSSLFKQLGVRRKDIRDYVASRHSWDVVGQVTRDVYSQLLKPINRGAGVHLPAG